MVVLGASGAGKSLLERTAVLPCQELGLAAALTSGKVRPTTGGETHHALVVGHQGVMLFGGRVMDEAGRRFIRLLSASPAGDLPTLAVMSLPRAPIPAILQGSAKGAGLALEDALPLINRQKEGKRLREVAHNRCSASGPSRGVGGWMGIGSVGQGGMGSHGGMAESMEERSESRGDQMAMDEAYGYCLRLVNRLGTRRN